MSIDQFLLSGSDTDLNYPNIRPTLDLNFARTKTLDPRITFERASGGTYVGADGLIKYAGVNEPRFDHDPETGESLGLLIEKEKTNLVTYSENQDLYGLEFNITIVPDAIISPDGNLTANKIVEDSTINTRTFRFIPSGANVPYTYSIWAKGDLNRNLRLNAQNPDSGAYRVTFNLSDGSATVDSFTSSTGSHSITYYGNGWYRCSITYSFTESDAYYLDTGIVFNDQDTYQGDGASGIYVWGAQLEEESFPTSYIPTQGSTRTRSGDDATMTGSNFSSWYNQNEGTVYCDFQGPEQGTGNIALNILKSLNDRITLGNDRLRIDNNSITQVFYTNDLNGKTVISLKQHDLSLSTNGTLLYSDNSVNINGLDLDIMRIGRYNPGFYLNGHISHLKYYNKRLPDSQIQALTR